MDINYKLFLPDSINLWLQPWSPAGTTAKKEYRCQLLQMLLGKMKIGKDGIISKHTKGLNGIYVVFVKLMKSKSSGRKLCLYFKHERKQISKASLRAHENKGEPNLPWPISERANKRFSTSKFPIVSSLKYLYLCTGMLISLIVHKLR